MVKLLLLLLFLETGHEAIDREVEEEVDDGLREFSFRWNRRDLTDGERIRELVKSTEGKRLMYSFPDEDPE